MVQRTAGSGQIYVGGSVATNGDNWALAILKVEKDTLATTLSQIFYDNVPSSCNAAPDLNASAAHYISHLSLNT